MNQGAKKFTFGESFLDSAGNVIVPEVENAREHGFTSGYEDGYAKAKSELESEIAAMMAVLNTHLDEISNKQQEAYQFVTSSTLNLTKAIVNKVLPHVLAKYGDSEVENFVGAVLKELKPSGAITILVNAALQQAVETQVKEHCFHFGEKLQIVVKSDDCVERTDCLVNWDDGGVEHIKSKLISQVDQIVEKVLANVPEEPEAVATEEVAEAVAEEVKEDTVEVEIVQEEGEDNAG